MPEISTSLVLDSSDTWIKAWKINETKDFFENLPNSWLDWIYLAKKNETAQIESISARFCLFKLCQSLDFADVKLLSETSGIPYFENNDLQISLTHSYPYVAAVISKKKAVGIDIEKKGRNIAKIAPRFLSTEEYHKWHQNEEKLTLAWSAKESVYKALKIPGLSFQKSIILPEFNENLIQLHVMGKKINVEWEIFDDFVLTLATSD